MGNNNIKVVRATRQSSEPLKPEGLLVADIVIRSVDRAMKDVRTLISSLQNAASEHYPNRTRLYDLYEFPILLDGHLTGIISRRNAAVRNKQYRFVDAKGKQVDGMETFLRSKCFRDIITRIMEAKAWGISGLEFDVYQNTPCFEDIPRKHIKPEFGVIALEQQDYTGYEYAKIPHVWVVGERKDYGYLLQCAFYAIVKKGDFADWAQFVEIFGQPVRIAKYDAHDIKTKQQLKTALDDAGSSLSLMIPKQAEFEMLDGKQSNANGDLQKALKDSCNDEMSMVVLTNTETSTGANGGSLAKAKEQGKQQLEITKDDIEYTLLWLNDAKLINILAGYGLPVQGGRFEVEKEVDMAALIQKANIDAVVAQQVPVGDQYWYDTYGIPKPDNYDELKAQKEAETTAALSPELVEGSKAKGSKANNLSAWHRLRQNLADFFDPAHQD